METLAKKQSCFGAKILIELMAFATSTTFSLTQRRKSPTLLSSIESKMSPFRHRITEHEEKAWRKQKVWSPEYLGVDMETSLASPWSRLGGVGDLFPSLISPDHIDTLTGQRHPAPLSREAINASLGSAFCLFHREILGKGKISLLTLPARGLCFLCPNVIRHIQYSASDPHQFSPAGGPHQFIPCWDDVADTPGTPGQTRWHLQPKEGGPGYWQVQRWNRLINIAAGWSEAPSTSFQSLMLMACFSSIMPQDSQGIQPEIPHHSPEYSLLSAQIVAQPRRGWVFSPGFPPLANRGSLILIHQSNRMF